MLARWRFEALNSDIIEPGRYARYADRYSCGLEVIKALTGKSYQEIDCDVIAACNCCAKRKKEM